MEQAFEIGFRQKVVLPFSLSFDIKTCFLPLKGENVNTRTRIFFNNKYPFNNKTCLLGLDEELYKNFKMRPNEKGIVYLSCLRKGTWGKN